MDPGPEATVCPFAVFDKAKPLRLNVLERKKWVHRPEPQMRQGYDRIARHLDARLPWFGSNS
jgi:hypothetical protein